MENKQEIVTQEERSSLAAYELRIKALEEENEALKSKLIAYETAKFREGAEQEICETQIAFLQELATERPLTLEESKKFELFVKTLHAVKAQKKPKTKTINAEKITNAELVEIAKS